MKKFLALFLSIMMIVSACPLTASADYTDNLGTDGSAYGSNDECEWSYDSDTKTMFVNGENIASTNDENGFLLPAYTVDENGNRTYAYRGFEKLVFGDKVKTVTDFDFSDMYFPNLASVEFNTDLLTEIPEGLFSDSCISSVKLPSSLETIGACAFKNSLIESVTIPSGIKHIGDDAFYNSELKSVTFEESSLSMGQNVFSNCSSLVSVDMSKARINYETQSTETNDAGETETVTNNVIRIPSNAFQNCTNLTDVKLNNSVEVIGSYAFYNCSSLESISLPSVTKIENSAFVKCSALKTVERDSSAPVEIGDYAFSGANLSNTEFNNVTDLGRYSFASSQIKKCVINYSQSGSYNSSYAFNNATNVQYVEVNGVNTVSNDMFNNAKVNTINISSVANIGEYAFYRATFSSLTLRSKSVRINAHAFENATYQSSEPLKMSEIVYLYSYAFAGFDGEFDTSDTVFDMVDAYAFYASTITSIDCTTNKTIGRYAFAECENLKSFENYESKFKIDNNAFENCTNLEKFYAPGLNSIGSFAFSGCSSLKTMNTPSVSSISSDAFSGCTSLTEVVFGNVESIFSYAFSDCTSLSKITFNADYPKKIGGYAFKNCENLADVNLSNVTSIDNGAFLNCKKLSFIELPSVTAIGKEAFKNCTSITSLSFGEKLGSVKANAFAGCINLKNATFSPAEIDFHDNIFDGCTSLNRLTFRGYIYGMPSSFGSGFADDFMILAPKGSDGEDFAKENNYPVSYIDGEYSHDEISMGKLQNGVWNVSEGTLYIRAIDSGELGSTFYRADGTEITAKEIIDGNSAKNIKFLGEVTSIPDNFLKGASISTEIVIPDSVKSIGSYAFYSINKTNNGFKLVMPKSLTSIGDYAFANNSVTDIDFSNCENEITLGEGVFSGNKALTSIDLPNNIKNVPDKLFQDDTALSTVTFNGQQTVGNSSFRNTALSEVTLPESVKSVGEGAFTNCNNLKSFTVKSLDTEFEFVSFTSPENSLGYNEKGNRNFDFNIYADPRSRAHAYASKALLNYKPIQIKYTETGYVATVKNQSDCARWYYYPDDDTLLITDNSTAGGKFFDENFEPITFGEISTVRFFDDVANINSGWNVINPQNVYFSDGAKRITDRAFQNCTNLKAVNIPDSVTDIGVYAFDGCTGLKSVTVGKGVQVVPEFAFRECINIQDLHILGAVTISRAAFKNCSKLVSLDLPDTLQNIRTTAFINCYSLVSVNFGKNVRLIDDYAFANLPFLDEININSDILAVHSNAFENTGISTTGITVNYLDGAASVALDGFNNSKVASLNFSKNFKEVTAYGKIPALKSISVDEDNTNGMYSYQNALYNDTTLLLAPQSVKTLKIKDDTTVIAPYAVRYNSLSIAVIPDGVAIIGENAFSDSSTLKAVKFPTTVETIGASAFENCTKIKTLNIPEPLKTIGQRAFKGCTTLAAVVLPEGLIEIGTESFTGCKSIVTMVVPQSVTSIGAGAFSFMPNLEKVYIWNSNIGYSVLNKSPKASVCTLAGSPAYEYAKTNKLTFKSYTDKEVFADECFAAVESLESYLGYCTDGHGDIEWLTVYDSNCENDGYRIGVCEYCSVILKEEHITAPGHNFRQVAYIKETATQRGIRVLKCLNCGETVTHYTNPLSSQEPTVGVYKVSGCVQALTGRNARLGENFGIENANIVIDGRTYAKTDENGNFSFKMKTGTYAVDIVYSFGFKRTVGLTITDHDVVIENPIEIVACDFNKDGKIDSADQNLFRIIVSSKKGEPAYLSYVDLNHDGYINAKDYLIISQFDGTDECTYPYAELNIA